MRFDHLMKKARRLHRLCCKHLNLVAVHTRIARRHAFGFASTMMAIEVKCHDEFLEFVKVEKLDLDAWLDEAFMPIEQVFAQDRRVLYNNIRSGMTVAQYVKLGDLWTPKKEHIKAVRVDGSSTPFPKPTFASPAEEIRDLKAQIEELVAKDHAQTTLIRSLHAQLDLVKRRLANLTKVFKTGSVAKNAQ